MSFELTPQIALSIATAIATIAAAWGGTRVALNGTRERVKTVEIDLKEHKRDTANKHVENVTRLTRIETKLDSLGPPVVQVVAQSDPNT